MSDRVNLKVSELTREAIKAEQKSDETIDDTLRRLLGLKPTPDNVDNGIAAYLSDEQREQVESLISFVEELGDFDQEVEEGGGTGRANALKFIAEESELTIAQLECSEYGYILHYRNIEGELQKVFATINDAEDADMEEIKRRTRERVEGALRRWGERNTPE